MVVEQPEVDLVAVADVVVDAGQVLVIVTWLADLSDEAPVRAVRQRHPAFQHVGGHRVDQAGRHAVIRERLTGVRVCDRVSTCEDAHPFVRCRGERSPEPVLADSLALIGELEERPVPTYGPAKRTSELVETQLGHRPREEVTGIERVVT